MARERAAHERADADEVRSADENSSTDDPGRLPKRLLERRSYLGLAGAAVATVAGFGTAGTAAAATRVNIVDAGADDTGGSAINSVLQQVHGDDVEVYFPPGEYLLNPVSLSGSNWSLVGDDATLVVPGSVQRRYLSLSGDGWTVDGFTIDLTADEAAPVNYISGTNWTFRNVEFVGKMGDPQYRADSDLLYPRVSSSGATGLFENVVATDGSASPGESSNRGLTWFGSNNQGEMIWRGCHFAHWANNTLYGANSAGRLVIEDCVFEDTNVGVRIGGNTVVRNSVWKQTGEVPAQRWTGDANGRGLWINSNQHTSGDILVEGCDFDMTGPDASTALYATNPVDSITVRDTRIKQGNGRSAVSLPGSGPMTADGCDINGTSTDAAISIENQDGSTFTGLCIQQPGTGIRIANSSDCRITDSNVNVDGTAFEFDGSDVETTNITRDATCAAVDTGGSSGSSDGSSSDDSSSGSSDDSSGSTDGSSLPNTLRVQGDGTATNYEFSVDGELAVDLDTGSLEDWDEVSDATATGWVTTAEHVDGYRFSGSVTDFTFVQGSARIFLDGEEVTPDEAVSGSTSGSSDGSSGSSDDSSSGSSDDSSGSTDESSLPNTLRVQGDGTATSYEFSVDGELAADPDTGSLEDWDNISDATATGWVTTAENVDGYRFSGSVTDFTFVQGSARIFLDGEEVTPDEAVSGSALPRTVSVHGTGTATEYEFTVDGAVSADSEKSTLEEWDNVDGNTANGWVTTAEHVDNYRFSGAITDFTLVEGEAEVYVDGEVVDPETLGSTASDVPHRIVVGRLDDSSTNDYVIEAGDTIEERGANGATVDADAGVAEGSVSGDVDEFRFGGSLTRLRVDGTARVNLERGG